MIRKHMISIAMIMPILLAALTAVPIHAQSDPTLFIDPATSNESGPPAMVSVNVDLTAQSGVQAYDFAITYDNSVLSVASMNTGPSFSSAFIFDSSVNEGAGFLTFGAALPGSTVDITTSDILASVTFNVIGFGNSPLTLSDASIVALDSNGSPVTITPMLANGVVQGPAPPPPSAAAFKHFKTRPDIRQMNYTLGVTTNTFFADVAETLGSDAYVVVVFTVVGGNSGSVTSTRSAVTHLTASQEIKTISASWTVPSPMPDRYFVSGRLFVSGASDMRGAQLMGGDTFQFHVTN